MPTIPVTANCGCGEIISWDEHTTTRATVLFCTKCGEELGTYGELEDRATAAVQDRLNRILGGEE